MDKATNPRERVKLVKFHLSKIKQIIRCLQERREMIRTEIRAQELSHTNMMTLGHSDPTGFHVAQCNQEIKKLLLNDGTMIHYPERWALVYLTTQNFFKGEEGEQILKYRFMDNLPVDFTLAKLDCVCRKTMFVIQDQVIHFALGVAEQQGLLKEKNGG